MDARGAGRGESSCRFCGAELRLTVADLGSTPLAQSLLRPSQMAQPESFYPLCARVCETCWLVQIGEFVAPRDIFEEYAYFSSHSASWLAHAEQYVSMIIDRMQLGADSFVVELGSNDGYLLRSFVEHVPRVPVLGIDPAANVGVAARARGVPTLTEFFGVALAEQLVDEGTKPDLIIGNNVLAQVPDLNDCIGGVGTLLAPEGLATFEFPHLLRTLERVEYDTIYHEHFSYFSLSTIREVLASHGLVVVDVDELPTHGGSLRVYAAQAASGGHVSDAVDVIAGREAAAGLRSPEGYARFASDVVRSKRLLLEALGGLKRQGKSIAGYGAPGKATTLLNYCGIGTDYIDYVVDRNPYKQGAFTPGTRIPIFAPERIAETRPDVIVVLPWNLITEISEQLAYTAAWGARLLVPIPSPRVLVPGEGLEA